MSHADLRICNLYKRFGAVTAVDGIHLDIPGGSFATVLGPSGCGKSTTLRLIGGFERADRGHIFLGDQELGSQPPHLRSTSMVFQNYALFPHMDVVDNIAFGLRERGVSRSEIHRRVADMLDLVELPHVADRRPHELSGGQQQRIALARALVVEPAVLLLDEPLGALDLRLRRQMQILLKRIQRQVTTTFVYVTHDQEEALAMSDRVVVMNAGRIEQVGTAEEVFAAPQTRFVAEFMGAQNIFDATVLGHDATSTRVCFADREFTLPRRVEAAHLAFVIRPGQVRLGQEDGWPGVVMDRVYKGAVISYRVALHSGGEIVADAAADDSMLRFGPGDEVLLGWRPDDVVVLPESQKTAASFDNGE